MSQTPTEVVKAFLAECGKSRPAMRAAFHRYFTPTAVWENVGLSLTTGPDEAMAWMEGAEAAAGVAEGSVFRAEFLAVAECGSTVLTERIDHIIDAGGTLMHSVRVMGAFEVADGRITAWRDYFDTAGIDMGGAHADEAPTG
jgi:limonene-1,2-epoxide hydrolase